jgi:lysosomal acid lipase/cholesteryl ester hydrolase
MIARNGYPAESHLVTTDDGYILTVHRIPPRGAIGNDKGSPILLQHGLLASSADWLVTEAGRGLGYYRI